MPKKQKTKFKFICPIFRIEVILILGDKKQLVNIVGNYEPKEHHNAECILKKDGNLVTGIFVWVEERDDYFSIVHETIHLARIVFQVMNIPFNSDNEEIIAYYQNYWVRKFWNKMSKFIKD